MRPRDFADWADRSPVEQVVHQIGDIEQALGRAADSLGDDRFQRVDYEALVAEPQRTIASIGEFLGVGLVQADELAALEFKSRNTTSLPPEALADLMRVLGEAGVEAPVGSERFA